MKTEEELSKYHAEWRAKNREKWNAYGAKWYSNNKERKLTVGRKWEEKNREHARERRRLWKIANKEKIADQQRRRLLRFKIQVVNAYGGECFCCGEKEIVFLTVEHLRKNGKEHRQVSGNFYHYLVRNNFPKEDLCILCMNCNWAERNGQSCPHKQKVTNEDFIHSSGS